MATRINNSQKSTGFVLRRCTSGTKIVLKQHPLSRGGLAMGLQGSNGKSRVTYGIPKVRPTSAERLGSPYVQYVSAWARVRKS